MAWKATGASWDDIVFAVLVLVSVAVNLLVGLRLEERQTDVFSIMDDGQTSFSSRFGRSCLRYTSYLCVNPRQYFNSVICFVFLLCG